MGNLEPENTVVCVVNVHFKVVFEMVGVILREEVSCEFCQLQTRSHPGSKQVQLSIQIPNSTLPEWLSLNLLVDN